MFLWLNGKEYNVLLNLKVVNAISLSLVLVQSNKVQQDTVGLTTFYPILYSFNKISHMCTKESNNRGLSGEFIIL